MTKFGAALLGTIFFAAAGLAGPAHASLLPTFELGEFCDTNCSGPVMTGHFDLINNTTDWIITGFEVGNPSPLTADTTRPGWTAGIGPVDYGIYGIQDSFIYTGNVGNGLGALSHDDRFTFSASVLASPFIIFGQGPNGPGSCSGTVGDGNGSCLPVLTAAVPEPAALSLVGAALMIFGMARRRRRAVF